MGIEELTNEEKTEKNSIENQIVQAEIDEWRKAAVQNLRSQFAARSLAERVKDRPETLPVWKFIGLAFLVLGLLAAIYSFCLISMHSYWNGLVCVPLVWLALFKGIVKRSDNKVRPTDPEAVPSLVCDISLRIEELQVALIPVMNVEIRRIEALTLTKGDGEIAASLTLETVEANDGRMYREVQHNVILQAGASKPASIVDFDRADCKTDATSADAIPALRLSADVIGSVNSVSSLHYTGILPAYRQLLSIASPLTLRYAVCGSRDSSSKPVTV